MSASSAVKAFRLSNHPGPPADAVFVCWGRSPDHPGAPGEPGLGLLGWRSPNVSCLRGRVPDLRESAATRFSSAYSVPPCFKGFPFPDHQNLSAISASSAVKSSFSDHPGPPAEAVFVCWGGHPIPRSPDRGGCPLPLFIPLHPKVIPPLSRLDPTPIPAFFASHPT